MSVATIATRFPLSSFAIDPPCSLSLRASAPPALVNAPGRVFRARGTRATTSAAGGAASAARADRGRTSGRPAAGPVRAGAAARAARLAVAPRARDPRPRRPRRADPLHDAGSPQEAHDHGGGDAHGADRREP